MTNETAIIPEANVVFLGRLPGGSDNTDPGGLRPSASGIPDPAGHQGQTRDGDR